MLNVQATAFPFLPCSLLSWFTFPSGWFSFQTFFSGWFSFETFLSGWFTFQTFLSGSISNQIFKLLVRQFSVPFCAFLWISPLIYFLKLQDWADQLVSPSEFEVCLDILSSWRPFYFSYFLATFVLAPMSSWLIDYNHGRGKRFPAKRIMLEV